MAKAATSSVFGTKNPCYVEHECDWRLCRDCYQGERRVKEQGSVYLRPTAGMVLDGYGKTGTKGQCDYDMYKSRAVFSNYTKKAVLHYMGQLWHKEPSIELTPKLEGLREKCTRNGEGLLQLLRSMHEEMLVTGRLGLYGEFPEGKSTDEVLPYISMYKAEDVLNWDEGERDQVNYESLNMVVLNESGPKRKDTFSFEDVNRYRVLMLGQPDLNEEQSDKVKDVKGAFFTAGVFEGEAEFDWDEMVAPTMRGIPLGRIPFVFVNSKHLEATPDDPPQLDLANQDIHIYRNEADYQQALHMQAQPTLALIGEPKPTADPNAVDSSESLRVGAGAVLYITNPAGDVKYVGVDPTGIPELRNGLENARRLAEVMSGSLTDTRSNDKESGDAMGKRIAGEACRLVNIAINAAAGLQKLLRTLAEWLGENPDDVTVTANVQFDNTPLTPQDILYLQQLATQGGPISDESVHMNIVRSGLSELTYEDEMEKIKTQEPRLALSGLPVDAPLDPLQQQAKDHADQRMANEQDLHDNPPPPDAKKPGAKK